MSREAYTSAPAISSGARSPGRSARRITELPTVDRSPSREYGTRGSPIGRNLRFSRSGNSYLPMNYGPESSTYHHNSVAAMGSPYYRDMDEPTSPAGGGHHRSRSASRPPISHAMDYTRTRYQSLDRGGLVDPHDREFIPIREPRDRSRDRSLERGLYLEDELYGRSARQNLTSDRSYIGDLQHQNTDLQRELGQLKRELDLTNQKLGSSMHSIKTFWSPELKKERALRKEESAKYSLINDQLKLLNNENQKQAMLVRQLEEELRMRMRQPSIEMQNQMEQLYAENEHLTREIAILRDTIKELELRIETQKQTLQARDESIKKLLEMLQSKGMGKEEERQMFQQMQAMAQKQLDEFRLEIQRRDQEIMAMAAKMKTLEEQHQDYQRHIAVLKESLCAKEEHYNMLQADVEELRARLEEKNRLIEKKTQNALQAVQERNRSTNELAELKDHMDIKDRKINVLQRKLDLHEANKKLQSMQQNNVQKGAAVDEGQRKQMEAQARQIEETKKQIEAQVKTIENERRLLEEQRKTVESKRKEVEEKEKNLAEFDRQLKKRKEQMDQLEKSLQKQGGTAAAAGELNKKLTETQRQLDAITKQFEEAKEEAKRAATETERLLQLVAMSQEEQNAKEKTIMELQQALKNAQAKSHHAQQQLEEQRKKEESSLLNVVFGKFERLLLEYVREDDDEEIPGGFEREEDHGGLCDDQVTIERHFGHLERCLRDTKDQGCRINELEDALRQSVLIVSEREKDFISLEESKGQLSEKVKKLEQRIASLQNAKFLRCKLCQKLTKRLELLNEKFHILLQEKRSRLQELTNIRQEAIELAISEKDARIAQLEVSGAKTQEQIESLDQLRSDRNKLNNRLKVECENSLSLLLECSSFEEELSNLFFIEDPTYDDFG